MIVFNVKLLQTCTGRNLIGFFSFFSLHTKDIPLRQKIFFPFYPLNSITHFLHISLRSFTVHLGKHVKK